MMIEGTLSENPAMSFTPTGKAVCNFYVDSNRCIAWEQLAEQVNQYIREGDKVRVWGKEKERWWTLPDGEKRSVAEFTINRIKVIERPKSTEDCCYYCRKLNIDCLKGCYNAMGGLSYMEMCKVEEGRCAEEWINNKECFEVKI